MILITSTYEDTELVKNVDSLTQIPNYQLQMNIDLVF